MNQGTIGIASYRLTLIQAFFISHQQQFYFQYHPHSGQSKVF